MGPVHGPGEDEPFDFVQKTEPFEDAGPDVLSLEGPFQRPNELGIVMQHPWTVESLGQILIISDQAAVTLMVKRGVDPENLTPVPFLLEPFFQQVDRFSHGIGQGVTYPNQEGNLATHEGEHAPKKRLTELGREPLPFPGAGSGKQNPLNMREGSAQEPSKPLFIQSAVRS